MSEVIERLKGYADPAYRKELLGKGSLDGVITDLLDDAVEGAREIDRLRLDRDKWHRVAMIAGAVTCSDGGHLYPIKEENVRLQSQLAEARKALEAAKEFADDEFSNCGDLNRKNRISRLCDKIDAALALPGEEGDSK